MAGHMVGGVGGVEGVGMEGKSGKRLGKERTRIEGQEHADEHVRKSRRVGGTSVLRPTREPKTSEGDSDLPLWEWDEPLLKQYFCQQSSTLQNLTKFQFLAILGAQSEAEENILVPGVVDKNLLELVRVLFREQKNAYQQKLEQERIHMEEKLEQERIRREQERIHMEEKLEQERIHMEEKLEQERIHVEEKLEQERIRGEVQRWAGATDESIGKDLSKKESWSVYESVMTECYGEARMKKIASIAREQQAKSGLEGEWCEEGVQYVCVCCCLMGMLNAGYI